jgi:hypothetical protein
MLGIILSVPIWLILAIVTIISFFGTAWYGNTHDEGMLDFRPIFGWVIWVVLNLVMYLIYFIIV